MSEARKRLVTTNDAWFAVFSVIAAAVLVTAGIKAHDFRALSTAGLLLIIASKSWRWHRMRLLWDDLLDELDPVTCVVRLPNPEESA